MFFLKEVAKDLIRRFGNNLSQVHVVFPGKRAKLFLNQYLIEESERPVWAPRYSTIDELFLELSPYRREDTVSAICYLYNVYREEVEDARDLDEFFSWGEIILSDFDDIDKHMAPAQKVFTNARDLASISEDYLTEGQEQALRRFFQNFDPEHLTQLKKNFVRLWDRMYAIYQKFGDVLRQRGTLYSGALYRDVAERIKRGEIKPKNQGPYVFVGFNILDECEETLFRYFQNAHEALFYWDYDRLYTSNPKWEAGLFINHDRQLFPNALPDECFDNLSKLKDITFIATSTDNAQCRHLPQWLDAQLTESENQTGIVLCDEHMLPSVLHSIPGAPSPQTVNVTMGYPLIDTPIYGFLNVYMSLLIDGLDMTVMRYRRSFIEKVNRHPYSTLLDEETKQQLFDPQVLTSHSFLSRLILAVDSLAKHFSAKQTPDLYDQLYTEALFQMHLVFTRFLNMTQPEEGHDTVLTVNNYTMRRLLMQVLFAKSIPFHGEPAVGLQVMGLLETRNIDFRHLLMLNVGEGILPKKGDDTSLIPYALRESFGLTTIKHRISVFAYYFYRLISRAEHVTLMYNENSSGVRNNEMSRFMRQLMAETDLPIRHIRLKPRSLRSEALEQETVEKTPEMVEMLRSKYINNPRHKLSPSAINCYLNCSMQFFFKYVSGLFVDSTPEDGIDTALMGTIFHDSAEFFYSHLTRGMKERTVTVELLSSALQQPERRIIPFINHSLIVNYLRPFKDTPQASAEQQKEQYARMLASLSYDEVFRRAEDFLTTPRHASMLTGLNHIIRQALIHYVLSTLRYDLTHAPFRIEGLEVDCTYDIELEPGQVVKTGGRIDRLESDMEGNYIVVDYKTSGHPELRNDVADIFNRTNSKSVSHTGYFLQTFLYALAVQQQTHHPVQPSLFYVNCARGANFDRSIRLGTVAKNHEVTDVATYAAEFNKHLVDRLKGLFSLETPFAVTPNNGPCKYCNYRSLCPKLNI